MVKAYARTRSPRRRRAGTHRIPRAFAHLMKSSTIRNTRIIMRVDRLEFEATGPPIILLGGCPFDKPVHPEPAGQPSSPGGAIPAAFGRFRRPGVAAAPT